LLVFIIKSIV
jgi:hypothetical protein